MGDKAVALAYRPSGLDYGVPSQAHIEHADVIDKFACDLGDEQNDSDWDHATADRMIPGIADVELKVLFRIIPEMGLRIWVIVRSSVIPYLKFFEDRLHRQAIRETLECETVDMGSKVWEKAKTVAGLQRP